MSKPYRPPADIPAEILAIFGGLQWWGAFQLVYSTDGWALDWPPLHLLAVGILAFLLVFFGAFALLIAKDESGTVLRLPLPDFRRFSKQRRLEQRLEKTRALKAEVARKMDAFPEDSPHRENFSKWGTELETLERELQVEMVYKEIGGLDKRLVKHVRGTKR